MQDGFLVSLQLLVDVSLRADQGLLPDIIRRHQSRIGLRDLNVITEDVVEPDLEGLMPVRLRSLSSSAAIPFRPSLVMTVSRSSSGS